MKVVFKPSFFRDVKKTPAALHAEIEETITKLEKAQALKDLSNLKKLKGHQTAYRIKLNNYRLCFYYEGNTVTLVRFLPRKDVYRFFP